MTAHWSGYTVHPSELATECPLCPGSGCTRQRVSPTGRDRFPPILVDACPRCGAQYPVQPRGLPVAAVGWLVRWNDRCAREWARRAGAKAGEVWAQRAGQYAARGHRAP